MTILYESAAGGRVEKEYDYVSAEEAQNLEAARVLADLGKRVVLLRNINAHKVKSADAQIDGEKWEIKTNFTPSATALDNSVRRAGRQAANLILNVKSKISDGRIIGAMKKRFPHTKLKRLVVIKSGKIFLDIMKR